MAKRSDPKDDKTLW